MYLAFSEAQPDLNGGDRCSGLSGAYDRKGDRAQFKRGMVDHQIKHHRHRAVQQIDSILNLGPIDLTPPGGPAMHQGTPQDVQALKQDR